MDYGFTEEQLMIRDLARKIAVEKALPVRAEYDETGHFPWDIVKACAEANLTGIGIEEKFGGMLNAFRYGAPPHGGFAPGVDRIVMLLAGQTNIREVIAFPLNQQAMDLMMNAPSEVQPKQLRELHIRLAEQPKKDA